MLFILFQLSLVFFKFFDLLLLLPALLFFCIKRLNLLFELFRIYWCWSFIRSSIIVLYPFFNLLNNIADFGIKFKFVLLYRFAPNEGITVGG